MIMERKSWEGARQACVDKQALSQVPLEAFRSVVTNIKYVIVYLIVIGSCYNVIMERKPWEGARQACVDKEALSQVPLEAFRGVATSKNM